MGRHKNKTVNVELAAEANAILDSLEIDDSLTFEAEVEQAASVDPSDEDLAGDQDITVEAEPGTVAHRAKRVIRKWPKGIKSLGTHEITHVATNPKLPGSKSYDRYFCYAGCTTVAEAIDNGIYKADIRWDWERGYIDIDGL